MTDETPRGEQLAAATALLEDSVGAAAAFIERQWRENPAAVVAAALGLGLLAGLLLGRRQ